MMVTTPSQQWQTHYSRLGGTADSADFQGPIARPVSVDFHHFFTQIATEMVTQIATESSLGQGIHLMRVQRAFSTCFVIVVTVWGRGGYLRGELPTTFYGRYWQPTDIQTGGVKSVDSHLSTGL